MRFRSIRSIFVVAILAAASAHSARAADITFDLTQLTFNQPSSSLTVDGYTLLFTGTLFGVLGTSDPNLGGFLVDIGSTMVVQLTAGPNDLVFKSYTIGDVYNFNGQNLSFDLSGGSGTSNGNLVAQLASYDFAGNYVLPASQSVTFVLNGFTVDEFADLAFFNKLTFTPVPEPSTYALGTIAAAVVGLAARRRSGPRGSV